MRAEIAKKKATDTAERNTMLAKGHHALLVTLLERVLVTRLLLSSDLLKAVWPKSQPPKRSRVPI